MDISIEKDLVEKAKADTSAFGELYDCYYPLIFGYVLKRTADIDASQDITSDVFFKALYNLRRFTWRNISFSAWLYRIANNEITNHYRKSRRRHEDIEVLDNSPDHAEPSPETELIEAEEILNRHTEFLLMHHMLTKLPEHYQEILVLRFFEKKKIREIAEILGKREGTVKSLIHRGLGKLKQLMEDHETEYDSPPQKVKELKNE